MKNATLAAVARGVTHALILAAILLAIGVAAVTPPSATAQSEPTADVGTPPTAVPTTPGDVQVRVGETVTLDGGALHLTMVRVGEDSRCPMDVMCVWSGRAVVWIEVTVDGVSHGEHAVTLYPGAQTQQSPERDATVDRYVISLVDLQPYPVFGNRQSSPVAENVELLDPRIATLRVTTATPEFPDDE